MDKELLKNGTRVVIKGVSESLNGTSGTVVGVASNTSLGITASGLDVVVTYIVKPDMGFPNEVYPYDIFNIPDSCLDVI